jgi:hypothetical protein
MWPNTRGCDEPSITTSKNWLCHIKHCWHSTEIYKIQNNITVHHNFQKQSQSVSAFWIKVHKKERTVPNIALNVLIIFSTICLCAAGFSAILIIKSDIRSWQQRENFMRCSVSNARQRFEMFQNSHIADVRHNTPIFAIIFCLSFNMRTHKTIYVTKN